MPEKEPELLRIPCCANCENNKSKFSVRCKPFNLEGKWPYYVCPAYQDELGHFEKFPKTLKKIIKLLKKFI